MIPAGQSLTRARSGTKPERRAKAPEEWLEPKDLVRLFAWAEWKWHHSNQPFPMFEQDDRLSYGRTPHPIVERDPEVALGPFRVWPPPPIWEPDVLVSVEAGTSRLNLDDPTPNAWWHEEPTESEEVIQMQTFTIVSRPQYSRSGPVVGSEWRELAQAVIDTAESGQAVRVTFDSSLQLGKARQHCYMRCQKAGVLFRSVRADPKALVADFWAEKRAPKRPAAPFQPATPPDQG